MQRDTIDNRIAGPLSGSSDYLRRLIRANRRSIGIAVSASLISHLLGITLALFAMQILDRVIPLQAHDTMTVLSVGLLIALLIQMSLKGLRDRIFDQIGQSIDVNMSQRIFNRLLKTPLGTQNNTVGTLAARISEFESVSRLLSAQSLFSLVDIPVVIIYIGLIASFAGKMALIPLLVIPVLVLFQYRTYKQLSELSDQEFAVSNRRHGMLVETINGMETAKSWNAEGWFSQRWYQLSSRVSDLAGQSRVIVSKSRNLDDIIKQLTFVICLMAGSVLVGRGHLSVGALIAAVVLTEACLSPFSRFGSMAAEWARARHALSNLDDLMKDPDDMSSGSAQMAPAARASAQTAASVRIENFSPEIQLENLRLNIGDENILAISVRALSIKPGEKIAIVGPTGSGKTSLLRVLTGLYEPSEGRCFLSGVDAKLHDPSILRKHIGYLPQQPTLFNSSLKDNLSAGIQYPGDDRMLDILRVVGLDAMVKSHPRGLNLMISEGGTGLSGGQSKLVALARILAQNASLLLLDEPTGSLDPQSEPRLIARLKNHFRSDQTVIYVTHKLNLLTIVDRIIVVDQGKVTIDGPRDEVLAQIRTAKAPAGGTAANKA